MQPRRSGASLLTQVEVKRSISILTAADWLRLHKVARALCREAAFEADDLLQEAFQRALDGTRQCTRTLDIVHFLAGVMRSIASDWRKARRRRPEMSLVTETGSLQDVVLQVCDNAPAADEVLAVDEEAARLKAAILALFVDDGLAQRLLEGVMDGLAGAQLRCLTGLSETEFASKRRLIRRRIDKACPKGLDAMSQKNKGQSARLDRLTDTLVEDILASSDADLLVEAAADNDDGAALARRAFERASRTVAVRHIARSKSPSPGRRLAPADIRALDPTTARGWLDAYLASNPETAGQLPRAVKRGYKLSDEDVYGLLEALQQRGVLTEKPIEQGHR